SALPGAGGPRVTKAGRSPTIGRPPGSRERTRGDRRRSRPDLVGGEGHGIAGRVEASPRAELDRGAERLERTRVRFEVPGELPDPASPHHVPGADHERAPVVLEP